MYTSVGAIKGALQSGKITVNWLYARRAELEHLLQMRRSYEAPTEFNAVTKKFVRRSYPRPRATYRSSMRRYRREIINVNRVIIAIENA